MCTAVGHVYCCFSRLPNSGHCKQIAPIWIELGEKFAGSPAVKIAEVDCTSNLEACKTAGIRGYPSLVLFKSGSQVAKYEGGRTVDAFSTFLKEHAGGHVETYEDSQHAAVAHDGLKVLTDEDFDATVAEGHAFIKFYAPWCGHCKKMAPVWAKLAHDFKDVDRLSVAKIDCTENDRACTRHGVNGYPTLLFLRDGVKIAQHSGGRDLASLTAYLNVRICWFFGPVDTCETGVGPCVAPAHLPAPRYNRTSTSTVFVQTVFPMTWR